MNEHLASSQPKPQYIKKAVEADNPGFSITKWLSIVQPQSFRHPIGGA